ncbi:hypothetical protein HELRODRAFT_193499 [Helobdella robusta]|uniref:Uncharacterized protein n=1 Tax=Helobdella robusta TaxID=6412 RepID=T1FV22_HELRO|nr:hypothetical protein HELRODRAFT_193499 [Helobdella robusta]ESN95665.1 hypothetical protein HELRODRAFT_193499 [Helobdella robusta]
MQTHQQQHNQPQQQKRFQQQQQTQQYSISDLAKRLNIDLSSMSFTTKLTETTDLLDKITDSIDPTHQLNRTDQGLIQAYKNLKDNLMHVRSFCHENNELIRQNIAEIDLSFENLVDTSLNFQECLSDVTSKEWTELLSQLGGLMAFFTGASVITILQIIMAIFKSSLICLKQRCCSDNNNKSTKNDVIIAGGKKKNGCRKCSNHHQLLFRSSFDAVEDSLLASTITNNNNNNENNNNNNNTNSNNDGYSKNNLLRQQQQLSQHSMLLGQPQGYSTLPTPTTNLNNFVNNFKTQQQLPIINSCGPRIKIDCISDCNPTVTTSTTQQTQQKHLQQNCSKKIIYNRFHKQAETDI